MTKYIEGRKVPHNTLDLTGLVFGKLTVIKLKPENIETKRKNHLQWLCSCSCGKTKIVASMELRNGDTISCGCYFKEKTRKPDKVATWNKYYATYQRGAKERNLTFNLNLEEFKFFCEQPCYYCGELGTLRNIVHCSKESLENRQRNQLIVNGIDRIVNSLGYEKTNIVACCGDCNFFKSKRDKQLFLEKIVKIYNHLGLNNYAKSL